MDTPWNKPKFEMFEKKMDAETNIRGERVRISPPPSPVPEPYVLGQCQICTRIVKSSTGYCKNCYWRCDDCKQVHERLRSRRRFYENRVLCETCYREVVFAISNKFT